MTDEVARAINRLADAQFKIAAEAVKSNKLSQQLAEFQAMQMAQSAQLEQALATHLGQNGN